MKKVIIIIAATVVVVLFAILLFPKEKISTPRYYTSDPLTWYDGYEINIKKASVDTARLDNNKLEYLHEGDSDAFFFHGYYKGKPFNSMYVENYDQLLNVFSELELEDAIKLNTKITITNRLDPSNGIPEAFMLPRVENGAIVFYFFVDEDWKREFAYTNILYAKDFKDRENIVLKPFDYSINENGIYIDSLRVDSLPTGSGGLFLGEIDLSTLDIHDPNSLTQTFIYMR